MNRLNLTYVNQYVNEHIADFHRRRIKTLEDLHLKKLISKNPYLLKAKNTTTAAELITSSLDALLSSSEEKMFGDFFEGLAVFVAQQTSGGHKSTAPGADLEFFNRGIHYVVSIKSGTSWGNNSQQDKLEQDLKNAVARLKQQNRGANVQAVLGICYGKTKTAYLRGYLKVVGQNFWFLISENQTLYTEIIEPIGYRAKEHNENYARERAHVTNLLTKQFIDRFCNERGAIDWEQLIEFNCGNYDLQELRKPGWL